MRKLNGMMLTLKILMVTLCSVLLISTITLCGGHFLVERSFASGSIFYVDPNNGSDSNTDAVETIPLPDLGPGTSMGATGDESTGNIPLIDMPPGQLYLDTYEGGLYPGSVNTPPPEHLAAAMAMANQIVPRNALGEPDPDGVIVMISVGPSNPTHEFAVFERQQDLNPSRNARLVIINGALGGQSARVIKDPNAMYWTILQQRLDAMGVTPAQVQILWLKEGNPPGPPNFPVHAMELRNDLVRIVQNLHDRFANLKIATLSSLIYGGYVNFEPRAYETGFAVKWLIEDQINGDPNLNFDPNRGQVNTPLLLWGPYLWADGVIPRSDGLAWLLEDYEGGRGGGHPSLSGEQKVADLLSGFFANDPTAQSWFPSQGDAVLVAIDAEADAFVRAVSPTQNFGDDPTLRAAGASMLEHTYLRFDASGAHGRVIWAKLSLRLPTHDTARSTIVSLVSDTSWQENTITFANAPGIDGGEVASIPIASRDGTIAADMTQAVASDDDGLLSVALSSQGGQPSGYVSKEGGQPPRIIVALATGDADAVSTVLVQGQN